MGIFVIIPTEVLANLACVPPIDNLNSLLSSQTVHVYLVRVPAAMPLLFWSAILEVELHLHLIYPLVTKEKYLTVSMLDCLLQQLHPQAVEHE